MGKAKSWDKTSSIGKDDSFSMIYDSMIKSKAFQDLTPTGKIILMYCRNQKTCKNGRTCLYQCAKERADAYNDSSLIEKYMKEPYFVFPAKHMEEYGLDRRNIDRYLKELEKQGFIKKVEGNKGRYKVNIYKFTDEWKNISK